MRSSSYTFVERNAPDNATCASAMTHFPCVRPEGSISNTVNSTRSEIFARESNGARQYVELISSHDCRVEGWRRWREFPTRVQIVRGSMFPNCRANLEGKQTKSSLHMGTISTEYVNLKFAVFVCVSADSRRSEVFDLDLIEDPDYDRRWRCSPNGHNA
jgi:hypothetical protein